MAAAQLSCFIVAVASFVLMGPSLAAEHVVNKNLGRSLKEVVGNLAAGDKVTIAAGYFNTSDFCNITISADRVHLQGSGDLDTIIDCDGRGRHMVLAGNNITLSNLHLQGGSPTAADIEGNSGGCLLARSVANVENCRIENCYAPFLGGAIYAQADLTLRSVHIASSSAQYGGAIGLIGVTLAMSGTEEAALVLGDNTAGEGGAVFAQNAEVRLQGSAEVSHNSAAQQGGAISMRGGSLHVRGHVTFLGDAATNEGATGGAIYGSGAQVLLEEGVQLLDCSGELGGAVGLKGGSSATLQNGVRLSGSRGKFGGGVYSDGGEVRILGEVLLEDHWAVWGGAIVVEYFGTITMSGAVALRNNEAWNGGGAMYVWARCTVTVEDGVLIENNLAFEGGGVYVGGAVTVSMTDVDVRGNVGMTRGGGFLVNYETTLYLNNVQVVGNYGENGWGGLHYGGAMHVERWANVVASGGTAFNDNAAHYGGVINCFSWCGFWFKGTAERPVGMDNNYARYYGGSIYIEDESYVELEHAIISNSTTLFYGGAVHGTNAVTFKATSSLFVDNHATRSGGAVDIEKASTVLIDGSHFIRNSAGSDGGGIRCGMTTSLTVTGDSLLQSNTAGTRGSGLALMSDCRTTMSRTRLEGHEVSAPRSSCPIWPCGGTVAVQDVATLTVGDDTAVVRNAADFGAGFMVSEGAAVRVAGRNVEVAENEAADGAGFGAVNTSSLVLEGEVLVRDNAATGSAGAFFASASGITLRGSTRVERNSARVAGAMMTFTTIAFEVPEHGRASTVFEGNTAVERGGAVVAEGSEAKLNVQAAHRVTWEANEAGWEGGALRMSGGAALVVEEEACPSTCPLSWRGNGKCDPVCLSRSCNWDDGDCSPEFIGAAEAAENECDRSVCSLFDQHSICNRLCFKASCDWSGRSCAMPLERLRQCPLFDAAVYHKLAPRTDLAYIKGGTVDGVGRCYLNHSAGVTSCEEPTAVEGALSFAPNDAADGSQALVLGASDEEDNAWALIEGAGGELEAEFSGASVEVMVKMDTATRERAYVVSSEHFAVGVVPFDAAGRYAIFVENGYSKSVTSVAFETCLQHERPTLRDLHGIISDGEGSYPVEANCSWLIAPLLAAADDDDSSCGGGPRTNVTLSFTELDIEVDYDFLHVSACADAACEVSQPVPGSPFNGRGVEPFTLKVAAEALLVRLVSDDQNSFGGFTASFSFEGPEDVVGGPAEPVLLTAGAWQQARVVVDEEGKTRFGVDGALVEKEAEPLVARPLAGGVAIGRSFLKLGHLRGEVDELRVWSRVRDGTDAGSSCGAIADKEGLVLCFGFEEGAGSVQVADESPGAQSHGVGRVGDRHQPWCRRLGDDGNVVITPAFDTFIVLGEAWGTCSPGKPRLPGAGFDYDPAQMEQILDLTLNEIIDQHSGCGDLTLSFKNNKVTAGSGGAIYQEGCVASSDVRGLCFLSGTQLHGGATTIAFEGNEAAGAGGAVYLDCGEIGDTCRLAFEETLYFPVQGSSISTSKLTFQGNTAAAYIGASAPDLATAPRRAAILGNATAHLFPDPGLPSPPSYVPGQQPLQLHVALFDAMASIVSGSPAVPNPWLVTVALCTTDQPSCSSSTSFEPASIFRYASEPAVVHTADDPQFIACPVGADQVQVAASVPGMPQIPTETTVVSCDPCRAGEYREEYEGLRGVRLWRCTACAQNEYVVDPNTHECQPCPLQSSCDGATMTHDVADAVWETDSELGIYILKSCPQGHRLVNSAVNGEFSALQQDCQQCTPGLQYIINPNKDECKDCPRGAICADGSALVGAVEGSVWEKDEERGIYLLTSCPAGHSLVNSVGGEFVVEVQQCAPCSPGMQYIINPNTDECQDCPKGALCPDGSTLVGAVEGSVWEPDLDSGVYLLKSCPAGHQLIGIPEDTDPALAAGLQECRPCLTSLEYIANPNTDQCTPCPKGWPVGCDVAYNSPSQSQRRSAEESGDDAEDDAGDQDEEEEDAEDTEDEGGAVEAVESPFEDGITSPDGSVWHFEDGKLRVVGCPAGTVMVRDDRFPGDDSCMECPPETFSLDPVVFGSGSSLIVDNPSKASAECAACPLSAKCPGGAALIPISGFWRPSDEARRAVFIPAEELELYPCPPRACEEGGQCREGREGPVCGICKEGYTMAFGSCNKCTGKNLVALRDTVAALSVILLLIVLYFLAWRPLLHAPAEVQTEGAPPAGCFGRLKAWCYDVLAALTAEESGKKNLPLQGWLKIIVSFYQVFSSFVVTFSINWPDSLSNIMTTSSASRVDLMGLPGFSCIVEPWAYSDRLLGYTLGLPIFIFLLCMPSLAIMAYGKLTTGDPRSHPRFTAVVSQCWWSVMFTLFVVYPTVSVVTMRSFNCQSVGSFGNLLIADYAVACPVDNKTGFTFVWSLLFAMLYPFGIPMFMIGILYRFQVPQMAAQKVKDATVRALIGMFKIQTSSSMSVALAGHLGLLNSKRANKHKINKAVKDLFNQLVRQNATSPPPGSPVAVDRNTSPPTAPGAGVGNMSPLATRGADGAASLSIETDSRLHTGGPATPALPGNAAAATPKQREPAGAVSAAGLLKYIRDKGLGSPQDRCLRAALHAHCDLEHKMNLSQFRAVMHDLLEGREVAFSGVESLAHLSREQLLALYTHDWVGQPAAMHRRASEDLGRERAGSITGDRRGSMSKEGLLGGAESVRLGRRDSLGFAEAGMRRRDSLGFRRDSLSGAEPKSPAADAPPSPASPQRAVSNDSLSLGRRGSLRRASIRRASLYSNDGELPTVKDATTFSTEKLRVRVLRIASRFAQRGLITIPAIRWDGSLGELEEKAIQEVGFLFVHFQVQRWSFEIFEMVRKLLITTVLAFVMPGSPAQVVAGFATCFFFLMLTARMNPYIDRRLEAAQVWALVALTLSLFYGMVLMVQESGPKPMDQGSMTFIEILFVLLNISILFTPLFQIWMDSKVSPVRLWAKLAGWWERRVEKEREQNPGSFLVRSNDAAAKALGVRPELEEEESYRGGKYLDDNLDNAAADSEETSMRSGAGFLALESGRRLSLQADIVSPHEASGPSREPSRAQHLEAEPTYTKPGLHAAGRTDSTRDGDTESPQSNPLSSPQSRPLKPPSLMNLQAGSYNLQAAPIFPDGSRSGGDPKGFDC